MNPHTHSPSEFRELTLEIVRLGPKAVLLDFDDTIYEYGPCHEAALARCHERFAQLESGLTFDRFCRLYDVAKSEVKKLLHPQAACHSRLLYFQHMLEGKFGHTEVDLTLEFETLYWDAFCAKMSLRPGVREFLDGLQRRGIRICLVTDLTARIQLKKIQVLGIGKLVDFLVTSEEAGADKPLPQIFRLALQKMRLKPEQTVVVGDDPTRDGLGGEAVGIKTFLVKK